MTTNLIGTVVGIVIAVIAITAVILLVSLYWQRIFGRMVTEDRYHASSMSEKGWPKPREGSTVESDWTGPSPPLSARSSRTSDDPMLQKAVFRN
ncbi:hypothetical protein DL764_005102 [Monosporascus ibericus]|uniref:Uncharacterized protein n=1 Tax=Monosporascus ibericus TaxID=155417 RepID=A0A4Q4TAG2_9PEZI|nr:hypothetical protein DL764_005102 [Monosporascus ibericus]